jgi:hypothetical protein
VPNTSIMALGTGDFSIQCWVRFASTPSGNSQGIYQLGSGYLPSTVSGPALGADGSGWSIYHGTSNTSGGSVPSTGVWYFTHYRRVSGTVTLEVDGTVVITVSDSTNYTNQYLAIGGYYSPSYLLNGFIDDFRYTKGVARPSGVVPSAPFPTSGPPATDPDFASVALLLPLNGTNGGTTFTDASSFARTITPTGDAQTSTTQNKWGGSSAKFDGSGDYLSTTLSSAIGTADFTFEAWVYINSLAADAPIMVIGDEANTDSMLLYVLTNGRVALYGVSSFAGSPGDVSTGAWVHVAATRQGTTLRAFVNGVQKAGGTHGYSLTNTVTIAAQLYTGAISTPLDGYLQDLRITVGVARYTANFTPPSAPFPTG